MRLFKRKQATPTDRSTPKYDYILGLEVERELDEAIRDFARKLVAETHDLRARPQ